MRDQRDQDQLLREAQAAQLLGLTPRALQSWRARGVGPRYVAISSRCIRYSMRDIAQWIDEKRRGDASRPQVSIDESKTASVGG